MVERKIENRKISHIEICSKKDVQARNITNCFGDIHLVHNALPEIDLSDVQLDTILFGVKLKAPIMIEAISGGASEAAKLNSILAETAENLGIGLGLGSQRAALENPSLEYTYRVAREKAPNTLLVANLGAPQIAKGYKIEEAKKAIEMISANALAIHLNPLQEVVQIEGEPEFRGCVSAIHRLASRLNIPVIAKEVGSGISKEVAGILERAGVRGIDVAGGGGTSWAAVEYYRAEEANDDVHKRLGLSFWDWGIPTAISLIEVKSATDLTAIASGGIRNGQEIAKAIALGADAVGMALPLLRHALKGKETLMRELSYLIRELRTAMFLVGAKNLEDLKTTPLVITGKTAEYLRSRGVGIESYRSRS